MNNAMNLVYADLSGILPGLLVIIGGLISLPISGKIKAWPQAAGIFFPVVALTLIITNYEKNSPGCVMALVFAGAAALIGIYNLKLVSPKENFAALIYAGSTICTALTSSWITLVFFWEVMAVSATYLVWLGSTEISRKAAHRYLIYHMLGGNLLLVGVLLYVFSTGTTQIGPVSMQNGAAFWLILAGVGINAAIPPMHSWVSDAYPQTTIAGTVYMNSFTTKAAVLMLVKVFAGTEFLVYIGVFMALFAACMAFMENDLRRLLSYHIVSQVGYMVSAVGVGSNMALDGALAQGINNIAFKGVMFMIAGAIIYSTGKKKITELGGLYKKMPVMSLCFMICSLAIAGFPLTNGFAGKSLIMTAVEEGGYHITDILLILASVGTWLSITLKINYFVFFLKPKEEVKLIKSIPVSMKAAVIIGTGLCIAAGIYPRLLLDILPFESSIHVFNLSHMVDYLILFAAATLSFWVFRKKLAPHNTLTLDMDWIYRRLLWPWVLRISQFVSAANDTMSKRVMKLCHRVGIRLNRNFKGEPESDFGGSIGAIIIPLIIMFCAFVLEALIRV